MSQFNDILSQYQAFVAIGCLFVAILLGLSLVSYNLRDEGRRERQLAERRAFKKRKNQDLRRRFRL